MIGWFARLLALLSLVIALPSSGRTGEPHWPNTLVLGTASAGGTYEAYGEALARLLTRELDLIVSTRATEGPAENLQLLEAGVVQLAFVTQGVALQGWNGTGSWTSGRQLRALRVMFPMYDTPFQFMILANSPVKSIAELAGKRIGIGPAGGTGGTYLPRMFGILKVEAPLVTGEWATLSSVAGARNRRARRRRGRSLPVLRRHRTPGQGPLSAAEPAGDRRPQARDPRTWRLGRPGRQLSYAAPALSDGGTL